MKTVTAAQPRLLVVNPAADLYGSDRMLLEAAAGAVERGWHVDAALGAHGPLADALTAAGVCLHHLEAPVLRKGDLNVAGLGRLVARTARTTVAIGALVRRARPDVVYVNTVTMPWWLVVARAMRVRSVVHVHEAEAALPTPLQVALTVPLRIANTVVFNSRTSRAVATAVPGAGRGLAAAPVVLNGLAGPAPTPPRETLAEGPRLLYVGRLSPRKGVDVAVEAVGLLHQRGISARLDIVGAVFPGYEWFEAQLRQSIAAAGLQEAITLHGFREDVAALRAVTDIALVPSVADESFGNVVVESLLAQRPAVVADQAGLREASEGFGSVAATRAGDAADLADGIATVVAEWSKWRRAAIQDSELARRRHAPSHYCDEIVRVLAGTEVPQVEVGPVVTAPAGGSPATEVHASEAA